MFLSESKCVVSFLSRSDLDNLQMLDDGSSDSAISMGSGSPQQVRHNSHLHAV